MREDSLREALRRADASAPPAQLRPNLAQRAHFRVVRRRRFRAGTRAIAAAILLAAGLTAPWGSGRLAPGDEPRVVRRAPIPTPPGQVSLEDEIRWLEGAIALHASTAEALRERAAARAALAARQERMRALSKKLQAPAPHERVRLQVEQAVITLVRHGYRLQHELDDTTAAETVYRQAVALAPDSPWAQVARQQLNQIPRRQGDRS